MGDENRRCPGRVPGPHQEPGVGGRCGTRGCPRASARRDPMAAAHGRRRARPCAGGDVHAGGRPGRRPARVRRRRRRHCGGRSATRASCGRPHRSTCRRRSRSRSGTNRHPRPAASISRPVRCGGSERSGCTPPVPGWMPGVRSWQPVTGVPRMGRGVRRGRGCAQLGDQDAGVVPDRCRARGRCSRSRGHRQARPGDHVNPVTGRPRWTATSTATCTPQGRAPGTAGGRDHAVGRAVRARPGVGRVVARADIRDFGGRPVLGPRSVAATRFSSRSISPRRDTSNCGGCRDD